MHNMKAGTKIRMRDSILMAHTPLGNAKRIFTNTPEIVAGTIK